MEPCVKVICSSPPVFCILIRFGSKLLNSFKDAPVIGPLERRYSYKGWDKLNRITSWLGSKLVIFRFPASTGLIVELEKRSGVASNKVTLIILLYKFSDWY